MSGFKQTVRTLGKPRACSEFFDPLGGRAPAGVAIDLIRCARLAKDRGLAGPIHPAAAFYCKHPPEQMPDDEAFDALEAFIRGT